MAADPNGYSDKLYEKSTALVKSIRSRWKVPLDRDHIYGHYQVPDGNAISARSYVVKRLSQLWQRRRRRTTSPSSDSRVSTTWVSSLLQKGQRIEPRRGRSATPPSC